MEQNEIIVDRILSVMDQSGIEPPKRQMLMELAILTDKLRTCQQIEDGCREVPEVTGDGYSSA